MDNNFHLPEGGDIQMRSMIESNVGQMLSSCVQQSVEKTKTRLLSSCKDPEDVLREREKAKGVMVFWNSLVRQCFDESEDVEKYKVF